MDIKIKKEDGRELGSLEPLFMLLGLCKVKVPDSQMSLPERETEPV